MKKRGPQPNTASPNCLECNRPVPKARSGRNGRQEGRERSYYHQVASRAINNQEVPQTVESQNLLNVVVDYTYALDTLDNYDYERLTIDKTTKQEKFHATYDNAMEEIGRLRDKFGGSTLFGNEKDDSFKSSIGQIYHVTLGTGPFVTQGSDQLMAHRGQETC